MVEGNGKFSTKGEIEVKSVELKLPPESEKIVTAEGKRVSRLLPKIERLILSIKGDKKYRVTFEDKNAANLILGLLQEVYNKLKDVRFLSSSEECKNIINNLLEDVLAEGKELKDIEPSDRISLEIGQSIDLGDIDDNHLAESFKYLLKPYFKFVTTELRNLLKE